jgi:hypothetical protein
VVYYGEQEALLNVEQPCPPQRTEQPGRYTAPIRTSALEPPYRSSTPGQEVSAAVEERPPRFNRDTITKWFYSVTKGAAYVTRRELLFALNKDDKLFNIFCAGSIHDAKVNKVPISAECQVGLDIHDEDALNVKHWMPNRVAMLRQCMDTLDRIDWENSDAHRRMKAAAGEGEESPPEEPTFKKVESTMPPEQLTFKKLESTRKQGKALAARNGVGEDKESVSRKLRLEVFMIYFKYQDMLLEYQISPQMNFQFERSRTRSEIHRDCQMDETHRGELSEAQKDQANRSEDRRPSLRQDITSRISEISKGLWRSLNMTS